MVNEKRSFMIRTFPWFAVFFTLIAVPSLFFGYWYDAIKTGALAIGFTGLYAYDLTNNRLWHWVAGIGIVVGAALLFAGYLERFGLIGPF